MVDLQPTSNPPHRYHGLFLYWAGSLGRRLLLHAVRLFSPSKHVDRIVFLFLLLCCVFPWSLNQVVGGFSIVCRRPLVAWSVLCPIGNES